METFMVVQTIFNILTLVAIIVIWLTITGRFEFRG